MIQLQKYTPEVYYNQSRDFQFIGRLYDLVLNSVKTNTDLVYNIPINENLDKNLADLLALTLGFKAKHDYNVNQLLTICSIFPTILRNKGNITAIELAGNALLHAEKISDSFRCYAEGNILFAFMPQQLSDLNLFKDLLDYILPAGMSYHIVRSSSKTLSPVDKLNVMVDTVKAVQKVDTETSRVYKPEDAVIPELISQAGEFVNSTIIRPEISKTTTNVEQKPAEKEQINNENK